MTCPYCGCLEAAEAEEYGVPAQGLLAQAIFVCSACGQSITRGRWTTGSTRRAYMRALRIVGPVVLYAVAFWLLRPYLEALKRFGGSRSTPGVTPAKHGRGPWQVMKQGILGGGGEGSTCMAIGSESQCLTG